MTFFHYSINKILKLKQKEIKNIPGFNKPQNAFWACSARDDWKEWNEHNGEAQYYKKSHKYKVSLKKGAKVLVADTSKPINDWTNLGVDAVFVHMGAGYGRSEWYRGYDIESLVVLNVDAVKLTEVKQ